MKTRAGKYLMVVLVGSAMALVLAACGGGDPTNTPTPRATSTPTATPVPGATAIATPTVRPTNTPDPSFDAEEYFSGKTIRLMVGYNPGGGTDAQARYMSKEWARYIPGNPRITVTNMTPNITQRNFTWNAKADGYTIALEAVPGIFDQISDVAQYDLREVSTIGVTSGKDAVWLRHESVPYSCATDAMGESGFDIILGTAAPTPADLGSQLAPAWLALEFDIQLVIKNLAAAGSAEQYIMIERGDTNSWYTSTVWSQLPVRRPGWVESGFVTGFMDMSYPGFTLPPNDEAEFPCPDVQSFLEDNGTEEQRNLWLAITGPRTLASKNLIGPPNMDEGPLNALRQSLVDAMNDEEFVTGLTDFTGIESNFSDGWEYDEQLDATTQLFLDNVDTINALQTEAFDKFVQ